MSSHEPQPNPDSPPPGSTEEGHVTVVRRSFPTPKRSLAGEDDEVHGIDWHRWGTGIAVGIATILAGYAAWVTLTPVTAPAPPNAALPAIHPASSESPAAPSESVQPAQPLDEAAALYLAVNPPKAAPEQVLPVDSQGATSEPIPAENPSAPGDQTAALLPTPPVPTSPENPEPAETPTAPPAVTLPVPPAPNPIKPQAPAEPGPLEEKYLTALLRAASGVTAEENDAWSAEIERIKSGAPLPPPDASQPPELQRLQSIYRREKEKRPADDPAAPTAADPEAREIELYTMGDDSVEILLNGSPVPTDYLAGSADTPGSVQKTPLKLKPGDVLGFRCTNKGGQRFFAVTARAGVRWLFSSSDRWEATSAPDEAWWKGEGKPSAKVQTLRGRTDYSLTTSTQFERLTSTHSSDYKVIWAGTENTCAFRYRIRKVDLPEKPAPAVKRILPPPPNK